MIQTSSFEDFEMKTPVSSVFTKKIVQKLPLTLVFAFLAHHEDVEQLLRLLCRGSSAFLDKNREQLWHFCTERPLKHMTIVFGPMNDHFTKPMPRRKVTELAFAYIQNDLYKIEEFVEKTLGFTNAHIGNRGFSLFDDSKVEDLEGLHIRDGSQIERANLRTLVNLLKKTSFLWLNRLEVVWPVLHILLENIEEFTNITGLHLEYHPKYHDLFLKAAEVLGPRL